MSRFGGFRLISQLRVGFGIILSFVLFFLLIPLPQLACIRLVDARRPPLGSPGPSCSGGVDIKGLIRTVKSTRRPIIRTVTLPAGTMSVCLWVLANEPDQRWGEGVRMLCLPRRFSCFTDSMFQILFVKLINGLWMRNQSRVSDQRSMSPGKHRYSSVLFSPTSEFVCESACRLLFYTHHRHSFILDPKDDTYQPCPKF